MRENVSNILIYLLLFLLGWGVGTQFPLSPPAAQVETGLISEAKQIIQEQFYEKVNLNAPEFQNAMVEGLVRQLQDPYSYLLPSQSARQFVETIEGEIGGIGILVEFSAGRMRVAQVLPDTPASKAGLQPFDVILEINKSPVAGLIELEAVQKIRGKPGSRLTLTVWREGWTAPREISLRRARIEVPSVWDAKMLEGDVGYLQILEFNKKTPEQLQKAVEKLRLDGARGLIIDLRNNPGGTFDAGKDSVDLFIESGVLVRTKSREKEETFKAKPGDSGEGMPIVILQNQNTASASEIFIAALKDHNIATTIGETTKGKAAMQSMLRLSTSSFLFLTTGHYFTPNGTDIHKKGIPPDIQFPPSLDSPISPDIQQIREEIRKTEETLASLHKQLLNRMNEELLKTASKHLKKNYPPE